MTIKNLAGDVILEYEGETLVGADLREANLMEASLWGADLRGASLMEADLRGADLRGADLQGANIWGADLWGADLRDSHLGVATGDGKVIKNIHTHTYRVVYTSQRLIIGCQNHPINDWWSFTDAQILEMEGRKALRYWRKWKEPLRKIISANPCDPTRS